MLDQDLINFIKEARKRGFDDFQIRDPLLKKGWKESEVSSAFDYLKNLKVKRESKLGVKRTICINIDSEIAKALEKRAKKNMFTLDEQIYDILRRSTINTKKSTSTEKIDDLLVSLFSRKRKNKK